MSRAITLLAAAIALVIGGSAHAQITATFNPAADGTLYQDAAGALANGSGSLLFAGLNSNSIIRRGIVRFDLTAIPPGSFVCSASLRMTAVNTTNNGPAAITLYLVSTPWGEGASIASGAQGGGGAAMAGDATWLHTYYPATAWSNAGGDMAAAASASTTVSSPGTYTWTNADAIVADVQNWVDHPPMSNGWILRSAESAPASMKHFGTRENTVAANRPLLTITYLPAVNASVTSTGPGCAAAFALSTSGLPAMPNASFGLLLAGGIPGGSGWIYLSPTLGASPTPLPNGCLLMLEATGLLDFVTAGISPLGPLPFDPAGAAALPIPLPFTPCLGGAQIAAQAVTIDPLFNGGFAVTNGLALVVGR